MENYHDMPQSMIPKELRRYLEDQMHYLGSSHELHESPSHSQEVIHRTVGNGNLNPWLQDYQTTYPDSDFINSRGTTKIGDFNRSAQGYCEIDVPNIKGPDSQQSNLALGMGMGEIQKSQYELEEQIKFMEDRLSNLSFKLSETRKCNKKLKTDINMTNSLLTQGLSGSTESMQAGESYCDSSASSFLQSIREKSE